MDEMIYVVEDDEGISEVYECAFESAGYKMKGFQCVEDMLNVLGQCKLPDLIVLDIMLPKMDGLTALKLLKNDYRYNSIPIIMISAKSEEHIKVNALVNGCEDYIIKPFGVMELVARINNIIKRTKQNNLDKGILRYKDLIVDDKKHIIKVNNNVLNLTPKCYDIIKYLVLKTGEVVHRDELFDKVWGEEYFPEARTLDIHINTIRQEIAKYSCDNYIKTVRGVGFILED